jgi:hypothetical protein
MYVVFGEREISIPPGNFSKVLKTLGLPVSRFHVMSGLKRITNKKSWR